MKPIIRQFLKFWLLMQLPLYGGILYAFMQFGATYWIAWVMTNTLYTFIIFPFVRRNVFEVKEKKKL